MLSAKKKKEKKNSWRWVGGQDETVGSRRVGGDGMGKVSGLKIKSREGEEHVQWECMSGPLPVKLCRV